MRPFNSWLPIVLTSSLCSVTLNLLPLLKHSMLHTSLGVSVLFPLPGTGPPFLDKQQLSGNWQPCVSMASPACLFSLYILQGIIIICLFDSFLHNYELLQDKDSITTSLSPYLADLLSIVLQYVTKALKHSRFGKKNVE